MNSLDFSSSDENYTALCSAITLQSNKNGFFQQIVNSVVASVDERWLNDFGRLKSNTERVKKCFTHERVKNCIYQMMDNVQEIYRGKSSQISASRRSEAEQLFAAGKAQKALLLYTQSIIKAPTAKFEKNLEGGPSLALALWGRSEVLFYLKKFTSCLEDVKLALKEKLPDDRKLEAYWRMTECYILLKCFDHARITLNVLSKMTTSINQTWRDKIRCKLKEVLILTSSQTIENSISISLNSERPQCTSILNNEGRQRETILENASSKLRLSYSEEAGKFLVARKDIHTGDTLVVEDPYVSCLSHEKYGTHCQLCLRRLEVAIPCDTCAAVAFCSVACRVKALATFHKFECRFLDLLIGSGMSILSFAALRIVSQQNLEYFLDADSNLHEQENVENPYKMVYSMVTHEEIRTPPDFLHRTLMAVFLMIVLKKAGYFYFLSKINDDIKEEEIFIAGILLRNLEVLQFNAHEISEAVKPKQSKSVRTVNIGVGLYLTASSFNHDCFPAVCRYFNGAQLIIKAVRPVSKDNLVGDNYGFLFTRMNREERQKKLKSRYWFDCRCNACLEDWSLLNKLDHTNCQKKYPPGKNFQKLTHYADSSEFAESRKSANCLNNVEEEIEVLNKCLQKPVEELHEDQILQMCHSIDSAYEVLPPPHKIYSECADKLVQYWMNTENVFVM